MAYKLYIYPNYICTIRKLPGPSGGDLLCGDIREMLQDEDPSVTHNRLVVPEHALLVSSG